MNPQPGLRAANHPLHHCKWQLCPLDNAARLQVYLFSLLPARYSSGILHLFLRHYSTIGVRLRTHAKIVVHSPDGGPPLERMLGILTSYGVAKVEVLSSRRPQSKRLLANRYLQALPASTWLLVADANELFHFRCADNGAVTLATMCGTVVDRLPVDGWLSPIRMDAGVDSSVTRQFQQCSQAAQLLDEAEYRYTLIPAAVNGSRTRISVSTRAFTPELIPLRVRIPPRAAELHLA